MRALFLSHTGWGGTFVVGSHHLSRRFAAAGYQVDYVCRLPYRPTVRSKITSRVIGPRLTEHAIESPLPLGRGLIGRYDLAAELLQSRMSTLFSKTFDITLVDEPKFAGLLRGVRTDALIYRPTDIYARMGHRRWRWLEAQVLDRADAVIATSGPVLDHLRANFKLRVPCTVEENGVDLRHFSAPQPPHPALACLQRPRFVYVGALDFRLDVEALRALGDIPNISVIVAGAGPKVEAVRALSHVTYIGPVSYDELPSVLQHCDVGLLPTNEAPANEGRSPMKIYEYLASGMSVLARSTTELRRREMQNVVLYESNLDLCTLARRTGRPTHADVPNERSWDAIFKRTIQVAEAVMAERRR